MPGADTIYYTMDGSHPWEGNAQATLYTGPVTITGECLLRLRAFARGQVGSDTAVGEFFSMNESMNAHERHEFSNKLAN